MIHYLYADQLKTYPILRDTMFRDRALQFKQRLGWDVEADAAGKECDDYDALNPLYVIWENEAGNHGGSMRFLPTTGPTMVNVILVHCRTGCISRALLFGNVRDFVWHLMRGRGLLRP